MSEKSLHKAVCNYLRMQYKGVLFNSDLAGSMRLTIGQAKAMKPLRSNRGFPDIAIYEPRGNYCGLFLELKTEGIKLYKKDNHTPINDHIAEQFECIKQLKRRRYVASFAIGWDSAKRIIDEYLNLKS